VETGTEVVLEPAVESGAEPVIAVASAVLPAEDRSPEALRGSLEGAQVALLLVRRSEEPQGAAVRAALAEPEVQVVLLRAPPRPSP
jgi:hypothetical protein